MIFDRRPFYLIGAGAALLVTLILFFALPKVTPEQRIQEQVAIVASEPWVRVRVDDVQFIGAGPEQILVRGVRLDTGAPVSIDFAATGPYTAPTTLHRLTEKSIVGQLADVKMVPRSLTHEPYRSRYQPDATHVGVAIFAGFTDATADSAAAGSAAAGSPAASSAAAGAPAAPGAAPAASPGAPPATDG